ncbi:hypothetical protein CB7_150 [Pectobacterium phage vB_PatM_CB7]|uniref:Uncharacterized protein n=1 Tax=Pectobacterium phage phiTE TaxID=1116482 RepID=K9L547_9CAUD|nr:hypothetical protein [Pectobacterium atrosepticum]YP_007392566.1 hypothetical protein phiTE_104 [Pectobacterium phage phiTE]AEZ66270.1 hypothetical protein phiTE_104 [Pectobacterium phage phiTE]ARB11708.1 hypothetical protein CB7_150 [Pectobacterium phage vB_PatM_CB7]
MNIKLTRYEARVLLMQLHAVADAGAQDLDYEELMALEQIIFKLQEKDA